MQALILSSKVKQRLDSGYFTVFQTMPERYFSAPGRTEISGNHTDHQHGCVLAGAVASTMALIVLEWKERKGAEND